MTDTPNKTKQDLYIQNLRRNPATARSPSDGLMGELPTSIPKSGLSVYQSNRDIIEAALGDLINYMPNNSAGDTAQRIYDEKLMSRENSSRALTDIDDSPIRLDDANLKQAVEDALDEVRESESLVTRPVISPISPLTFDPETDIDRAVNSLKFLESGGKKNPYKTKGKKVTKGQYKGEQAVGAYGVMESNVPIFTKEYYGKELTVEQFINSPKAQDEVAKEFILQNYEKYGNLEDAISTWFTGDPLDQAIARKADDGSIDVNEYMIRFNRKFNPE